MTKPETAHEPRAAQPYFDEQFGLRFGLRGYYLNLRIGSEKRTGKRLREEGQVRVSGVAFIYCVICSAAIMLFGTLAILYLMKSAMGFNLIEGHSWLHPLFELVN